MTSRDLQKMTNGDLQMILLHDGYPVPFDLYQRVLQQASLAVRSMTPNVRYTAERLLGESFWSDLSHGDRRRAGHCMAHLVARGHLPLVVASEPRL